MLFPLINRMIIGCAVLLLATGLRAQDERLFTSLSPAETGVLFQNKLVESAELNIITYEYYYNGGGVAAGDFNNDGLTDLYFTSNIQPNKLYLNKGNFRFEDITRTAGVAGRPGWKTGVSVADVNGDGFLDIYVCYSGDVDPEYRSNQLFINNGNLTFTDRAKEMGADDKGHSTHAAFFDYDRDGDLDLFVLNHNIKNLRNFDAAFVKKMVDPDAGDHLYENINGKFTDVTQHAGIIANPLGYGLGVNIADINNDGWPDIYVSNDYVEEDYLYINNRNGTFKEQLKTSFGHLSNFSMGVDIADINNDGHTDIYTLDMLPEDNRRQKLLYAPDNYELYNNTLANGFYHQLMRNMLQLNNGNGTFSEIGQYSGVSNTDWSWAALLADYNNDGWKDLFVTNGYGRDMINRDFMKFYANERLKHLQGKTDSRMFQMLQGIKSTPLHNYIFENRDGLQFRDRSVDWGFEELNFSHGAVYADLDNDGDLDLVMNRMNQEAGIYRNNTRERRLGGNYLKVALKGPGGNSFTIGARVTVHAGGRQYVLENYPVHGFQSSMQEPLHFGFPVSKVDTVIVRWPDGTYQMITANIPVNGLLSISKDNATATGMPSAKRPVPVFGVIGPKLQYQHKEDLVNDFKIQPLMPNMLSYSGPRIARADVNGDKLEDIYICGPKGQAGTLFLQQKDGSFQPSKQQAIEKDADAEDCGAVFFDADKDGDMDLYVVSGGYAFEEGEASLQDRLYFNLNGNFEKYAGTLPSETNSGSVVLPIDLEGDGDQDLFIGSRVIPGKYPELPASSILVNDGKGNFTSLAQEKAPQLTRLGLVTDAVWADIDKDSQPELIVCGEWMRLRAFRMVNGKLEELTTKLFNDALNGWWNRLSLADLDKDGDLDLVAGNWGLNSQLKANEKEPIDLYYGDFDGNGFVDPLLCYYIQGKSYPMASRDEMTDQMVSLRQRFPTYDSYADATISDILSAEQLQSASQLSANYLQTTWFENKDGKFYVRELPAQANFSPVYAIHVDDYNMDGNPDILLGGNIEQVRIKIGKIDASFGTLLLGDGKGGFRYLNQSEAGLNINGCIRDIISINGEKGKRALMIGLNNAAPVFLTY
ncbi:VCBS repeat-containing protein [Flavihumibacter rivuli]|uniref:VCBS repeat-containing protein n=1 Tax=Flavihumibacter rivuli TaxID=2838156 RepID=UPI001BDEC521|nr:VCBS repeat-containing protein [Flavihumibacter rivuli]ULQ56971.1 VCBS repeat-containing protein [Flavihumibacter rivuli]